jgi:hypothetical protein
MSEFIAIDDKPTTLPAATLKALADAKADDQLLQEVDCYWNPPEASELKHLDALMPECTLRDYRKRHHSINVDKLPDARWSTDKFERIYDDCLKLLSENERKRNEQRVNLQKSGISYFELDKQPIIIELEKQIKELTDSLRKSKRELDYHRALDKAIVEWKPERRVILKIDYTDHETDAMIEKLRTLEEQQRCANIVPKLIEVIRMRKAVMAAKNARRGNPMRNVYLEFNLTPMDYRIQASWVIHRNNRFDEYEWRYTVHYLHITEYNLLGERVVEYKSREQLMSDEEKAAAEAEAKRLKELAKTPYTDYFYLNEWRIDGVKGDFNKTDVVQDVDILRGERDDGTEWQRVNIIDFIATNVNYETQTLDIVGYTVLATPHNYKDTMVKRAKNKITLTFVPKSKREKTSKMEKQLQKIMQNVDLSCLS